MRSPIAHQMTVKQMGISTMAATKKPAAQVAFVSRAPTRASTADEPAVRASILAPKPSSLDSIRPTAPCSSKVACIVNALISCVPVGGTCGIRDGAASWVGRILVKVGLPFLFDPIPNGRAGPTVIAPNRNYHGAALNGCLAIFGNKSDASCDFDCRPRRRNQRGITGQAQKVPIESFFSLRKNSFSVERRYNQINGHRPTVLGATKDFVKDLPKNWEAA